MARAKRCVKAVHPYGMLGMAVLLLSVGMIERGCCRFYVYVSLRTVSKHSTSSGAQLLVRGGKGDGHIPRNIRLTLAALELLQPFVDLVGVERDMQDYIRVMWKVRTCVLVRHEILMTAADRYFRVLRCVVQSRSTKLG